MTAGQPKRLVVALDHHFVDVNGRIYTELAFGYDYWREYLDVFDDVQVLARVRRAPEVPQNHFVADGPRISFLRLPDFYGPYQLLARLPAALAAALRAARSDAAFILRTGVVSNCLWLPLMLLRKPYAREVQGIVRESVREATRKSHPRLGPAFAHAGDILARLQIRWAASASYVSEACRRTYPAASRDREFVFSSVQLDESLITEPRAAPKFDHAPLRIVSVGRLELEKGHRVLVDAVASLHRRSAGSISLTLIGGGSQFNSLREQVVHAGLADVVFITGPVQYGRKLFERLDEADLFAIPSLTEGMPRALIEAMARGLPAIGTQAGGIPELLETSQLTAPNNSDSLATAIAARLGKPDLLARESRRNFEFAVSRYSRQRMRVSKHGFWSTVLRQQERRWAA